MKSFSKSENIDTTVFFGQRTTCSDWNKTPKSFFAYNKKTDTYYVNVCERKSKDELVDLLDAEKIKNHFQFIKISDKDKVFIGKNQISNDFWNTPQHLYTKQQSAIEELEKLFEY